MISPVEGLLVDSNTLADGPDPANEQSSEHHLEDTAGDGLAVAARVGVVSSDHGADTGSEDVHNHNNGGNINGNVGVGSRAASGVLTFSDGGSRPGVHGNSGFHLVVAVVLNFLLDHITVGTDSFVSLFMELAEVSMERLLYGFDNIRLADVLTVEGNATGRLNLVNECLAVHS